MRSRRLELPRPFGHNDLNVARLPVPPRPHSGFRGRYALPLGRSAPLARGHDARKSFDGLPENTAFTPAQLRIAGPTVPLWDRVTDVLVRMVNPAETIWHEHCRRPSDFRTSQRPFRGSGACTAADCDRHRAGKRKGAATGADQRGSSCRRCARRPAARSFGATRTRCRWHSLDRIQLKAVAERRVSSATSRFPQPSPKPEYPSPPR